jgi:hypothetical protein
MSRLFVIALAFALSLPAAAEEAQAAVEPLPLAPDAAEPLPLAPDAAEPMPYAPVDAVDLTLDQFMWVARPVVVFADTPADPNFIRQVDLLMERTDVLEIRDVVVIIDTDPANPSEIRRTLRPRGFSLVVLGKDGRVIQRKPAPWDVREITRAIDRTPQGQQEIQDRLREGG